MWWRTLRSYGTLTIKGGSGARSFPPPLFSGLLHSFPLCLPFRPRVSLYCVIYALNTGLSELAQPFS